MPLIQATGIEAEVQFNLGELGLPIRSTEFKSNAYTDLISDDRKAPFTGVGASGVNPIDQNVGIIDKALLGLGNDAAEVKFGNALGDFNAYHNNLSAEDRTRQVELLVRQPISSEPTTIISTQYGTTVLPGIEESYAGNIPSRQAIISLAAEKHNIEPELLTAVILAEQRDQSANEDAKDVDAATSILQGNTSIGLGQVVVSTAQNNDLFADLLSVESRNKLSHGTSVSERFTGSIAALALAASYRALARMS